MDGILIINKEKEWTSNDVVQKVKYLTKTKVGHTGTLDPNATGVLPLLIGKGTLLSKYLINHDKEYIATIKLGIKTSTADLEGEIIENKIVTNSMMDKRKVEKALKSFIGKQIQKPPIYSAIKVKGKKLYEYARQGKNIEIPSRKITIYNIELINISIENKEITYKVKCSKGTYIRTLSEDIAKKLGTVGFMKELNRTQVGDFYINQSIKINEISNESLDKKIITIEQFFENNKKIVLDCNKIHKLFNGIKIQFKDLDDGVYRVYDTEYNLICISIMKDGFLKRDIWIKNI